MLTMHQKLFKAIYKCLLYDVRAIIVKKLKH